MSNALAAALLAACLVPARAQTIVEDAAAYARLSAVKVCTLQWVDVPAKGVAAVSGDPKTTARLACDHVSKDGNTYVRMKGDVLRVSKSKFTFKGVILVKQATDIDPVTLVSKPGVECRREGEFVFARRNGRRFWRLQEPAMTNPCNKTADYVDVWLPGTK